MTDSLKFILHIFFNPVSTLDESMSILLSCKCIFTIILCGQWSKILYNDLHMQALD